MFHNCYRATPKISEEEEIKSAFCNALQIVTEAIYYSPKDCIRSNRDIINLYAETLKADLFGTNLTNTLFMHESDYKGNHSQDLFPQFFFKEGEKGESNKQMLVGDNTIVRLPFQIFDHKQNRHSGTLLPELGLILRQNEYSRLATASIDGQSSLKVDIIYLYPTFSRYYTNGAYWIKNDKKVEPVKDVRLAIIYSLAQWDWKFQRESEGDYSFAEQTGWAHGVGAFLKNSYPGCLFCEKEIKNE